MEQNPPIYRKPKYTKQWLGLHCLYVLGLALMLTLISCGIDSFASGRVESGLLNKETFSQLSESIAYCFSIIAITSVSLMLVELTFRKGISYLQYALLAMSLTLFYLLLLALSEKMPFGASYAIVSVMTVGLIVWFINGITRNPKAGGLDTCGGIRTYVHPYQVRIDRLARGKPYPFPAHCFRNVPYPQVEGRG